MRTGRRRVLSMAREVQSIRICVCERQTAQVFVTGQYDKNLPEVTRLSLHGNLWYRHYDCSFSLEGHDVCCQRLGKQTSERFGEDERTESRKRRRYFV